MSASAHRVSVFFALALAARGALAVAQTPNEIDPARRAYEEGVAHLEAARYQEAALALERSYALRPVPVALYNLALAWRGLGRYRAAVGLFDRYLQSPDPAATPERLDAIRAEREELLRALVHAAITVTPRGATLRVDGRDPAPSPESLELDPGGHVLEWNAPAHRPHRETITATPGSRPVFSVALEPVREGRLQVEASSPAVLIEIDGQRGGMGRVEREFPVGEHVVALRASGYRPVERRVTVTPGATVRLVITMERNVPGWVLPTAIVGGAVLIGAGITAGVLATRPDVPALHNGTWGTYRE